MSKIDKSLRREAQSRKARTPHTSRAFLHTLDRLQAERDRARLARSEKP